MKSCENKLRSKIILVFLILFLSISLVIAPTTTPELPEGTTLDDIEELDEIKSEENIEVFINGEIEERNRLWENQESGDIETTLRTMTQKLADNRWKADTLIVTAAQIGKDLFDKIAEEIGPEDLTTTKDGISVSTPITSANQFFDYIKEEYNVDISPEARNQKVQDFLGFDKLKWADLGQGLNDKPRNIIGDPDKKIWLDLDRIPLGTKSVIYEEGKFIIEKYDGSKMIISGETDKEGNVVLKNTKRTLSDGTIDYIKINPFDVKFSSESGNGEFEINEEGFVIKGDGIVDYEGNTFKRISGSEGIVKINKNGFVLRNTEMQIKGVLTVRPKKTDSDFTFYVGDTRRFLDFFNVKRPDSMSYGKVDLDTIDDSIISKYIKDEIKKFGDEIYKYKDSAYGDIYLRYDENGFLTKIKTEDINNGEWFNLANSARTEMTEKSEFFNLLLGATKTGLTEKVIEKKVSERNANFVSDYFSIYDLTELENLDSYQSDFAALLGENVIAGGSGEIELHKDMNSLTFLNGEDFNIINKDETIRIKLEPNDKTKVFMNRKPSKGQDFFEIDDISAVRNDKKILEGYYMVKEDPEGDFISERVVAGRMILQAPFGMSNDFYVELDKKDAEWVKKFVNQPLSFFEKEDFIQQMRMRGFSLKNDFYIPEIQGTSVDASKFIQSRVDNLLFPTLSSYAGTDIEISYLPDPDIEPKTIESLKGIISKSLKDLRKVESGKISIEFKNRGNIKNPSLYISIPGKDQVVVDFKGEEAKLINDALGFSLRMPDISRMDIKKIATGEKNLMEEMYRTRYWPPIHLKSMWRQNIGKSSTRLGLSDAFELLKWVYSN